MTEVKNEKVNLRDKFLSLTEEDQKRITTFFNLHNAAAFCFDQMSNEAKEYCSYCVQLSNESKSENVPQDSAAE